MKKLFMVVLLVGVVAVGGLWWSGSSRTDFYRRLTDRLGQMAGPGTVGTAPRAAAPSPVASAGSSEQRTQSGEPQAAGEVWQEPLTGMEFVKIPSGCFQMGSPVQESGRDSDEGPVHKVCLDDFWMGRYEVTRQQFRIFVERSGYVTDAEREGYSWVYTGKWEKKPGYSWRRAGFAQTENHPVVNVSWNDAKAMAAWLEDADHRSFSLPSEAQWEYACRAGSSAARFWGDQAKAACRYANVADLTAAREFPAWTVHPCSDGAVFTAPVGNYESNGFGLYDMLGNVWEWCEDVYLPDAYTLPTPSNPVIEKGGRARVVRGGSWYSRPELIRCASRDRLAVPTRRGQDQGFRLAIKP